MENVNKCLRSLFNQSQNNNLYLKNYVIMILHLFDLYFQNKVHFCGFT